MSDGGIPDPALDRLSLYHCYLTELLRTSGPAEITSRSLAEQLDLKEETVRRDISFVGAIGKPGYGYDVQSLLDEIGTFLGISTGPYPIVMVGTAEMLHALGLVFPPALFGMEPIACFSELTGDSGKVVDGIPVRHISEISHTGALGATVALVACSPDWVQISLDLLGDAGVSGVLLITPILKLNVPEWMNVTKMRMPCDLKTLACRCKV